MQNQQKKCQIQGHRKRVFSRICTFPGCPLIYNWMCDQCVWYNEHRHRSKHNIKSVNELQDFIKNERLPQIEVRIQQLNEIQIKYKYLQQIFNSTSTFGNNSQIQQSSYEQQEYNEIEQFYEALFDFRQIFFELLKQYEIEVNLVNKLQSILEDLRQNGIFSLNDKDMKFIIQSSHREITNYEIKLYQKLKRMIGRENYTFYNIIRFNLFENGDQLVTDFFNKLLKLNECIFFQEYKPIKHHNYNSTLHNGRQMLNSNYQIKKAIIGRIFSDKFKYILFKSQFYLKIDEEWKYLFAYNRTNINVFILNRHSYQVKLMKKKVCINAIYVIYPISLTKLFIVESFSINVFNFIKNRFENQIVFGFYKFENLIYGREKQIIVVQLRSFTTQKQFLAFYKDSSNIPFINCSIDGQNTAVILVNKDQQLLTQTGDFIRKIQIDYEKKQLIEIRKIKIRNNAQIFLQNHPHLQIIQIEDKGIQLFDHNFNMWFRIPQDNLFLRKNGLNHDLSKTSHVDLQGTTLIMKSQGKISFLLGRVKTNFDDLQC